jgi:hypothetical protein
VHGCCGSHVWAQGKEKGLGAGHLEKKIRRGLGRATRRPAGSGSAAVGDAQKGDDAPGGRRQHLLADAHEGEDAMAAHGRGMRCSRGTAWAMQEREEEDVLQGTVAAVQESEEENARQKDARLGLREHDL